MRELTPFATREALQQAIDNGGRFYNFFSKAEDSIITRGELAKAAGVFSAGMNAILFLELTQWELSEADRLWVRELLEPSLQARYESQKPIKLRPSEVESQESAGCSVVVTGYPRFIENRKQFGGIIFIPVMAGNVTTFMPIPLQDQFDVYEVFDDKQMREPNSVIATVRGQKLDHDGPIRFGGILRDLKFDDKTEKSHRYFIETVFYTKLKDA